MVKIKKHLVATAQKVPSVWVACDRKIQTYNMPEGQNMRVQIVTTRSQLSLVPCIKLSSVTQFRREKKVCHTRNRTGDVSGPNLMLFL